MNWKEFGRKWSWFKLVGVPIISYSYLYLFRNPYLAIQPPDIEQLEFSSVREAVKERVRCKSVAVKRKNLCVIFGVCNSVRLLQFLCFDSVTRRRLVYVCNSELQSVETAIAL
jgi:hypothetical protein